MVSRGIVIWCYRVIVNVEMIGNIYFWQDFRMFSYRFVFKGVDSICRYVCYKRRCLEWLVIYDSGENEVGFYFFIVQCMSGFLNMKWKRFSLEEGMRYRKGWKKRLGGKRVFFEFRNVCFKGFVIFLCFLQFIKQFGWEDVFFFQRGILKIYFNERVIVGSFF